MLFSFRCAFVLGLLVCGGAQAAVPPAAAHASPLAAEKAADAQTIPIGELPRRLVEESAFIQRVVQRSMAQSSAQGLEQELDRLTGNVDALGQRLVGKDFESLSLSGLESLERHLVFLNAKVGELQDDLQATTRPLSEGLGELAQRRKVWRDTQQASAELIPRTLLASIEALDSDFQRAADAVAKPLSLLLKLNHEADVLRSRVADGLLSVRNQIATSGRRLWSIDSESLISVLQSADGLSDGSLPGLLNGYAIQAEFGKEFDRAYRSVHILLIVVALLALPVFVYLSRWAARVIGRDGALEAYRCAVGRPYSACLLGLVIAWLITDFDGPLLRRSLLLVLAWLPAMRLQPPWVNAAFGRWKYASVVFFIISVCGLLVSTFPLVFRPLLLLNGLLLLGALAALFFHPPAVDHRFRSVGPRRTRVLTVIYLLIVGAAVVANIVGSVRLTVLLTEASIGSLYLAFVLFAVREFVGAYAHILRISGVLENRASQAGRLFEVALTLFNLALVAIWLVGTLSVFRVLRLLKSELNSLSQLAIEIGSISLTVGGVVLFFVSVLLSVWIAKTTRSVLAEDVLPAMTLPRGVANSVSTMSYYFLLLLGLLVALSVAGFQLSQLALVLGALSVGIGFGLNTVVNNFVSGLILMVERPIQPGDSVEVSGTTGTVREIGIRTTTLTTFDGADVMIPNGLLLADKLINWTFYNDRRRIEVPVGVAYASEPRRVQAILLDVARGTPGVSHDPLPVALFMGFGESSLDFCVRAWTDDFGQSAAIRSELAMAIHEALKRAGIAIPYPHREVHLRPVDPAVVAPDPLLSPAPRVDA